MTAVATTVRQSSWAAAVSSAKPWSASRLTIPGWASYAWVTRSRKAARMMQPARQMAAILPRPMSQPYCSLPTAIWWNPWV
ncbi:hypothetical protein GA0115236_104920 [Streptomyces sp. IgraMP-1]|nr:hypothetical protein GA0115236_104920 [Streptomyces sp. IgraMP-1]